MPHCTMAAASSPAGHDEQLGEAGRAGPATMRSPMQETRWRIPGRDRRRAAPGGLSVRRIRPDSCVRTGRRQAPVWRAEGATGRGTRKGRRRSSQGGEPPDRTGGGASPETRPDMSFGGSGRRLSRGRRVLRLPPGAVDGIPGPSGVPQAGDPCRTLRQSGAAFPYPWDIREICTPSGARCGQHCVRPVSGPVMPAESRLRVRGAQCGLPRAPISPRVLFRRRGGAAGVCGVSPWGLSAAASAWATWRPPTKE